MHINGKYKIGFRAIKTAIAVFFCMMIAYVFNRDEMLFAAIAAIICMEQTYDATFKTGINRIVGTITGGIVGYSLLEISLYVPFYKDWMDMFFAPICLLLIIYVCNTINHKGSVSIGCIVLLSIISRTGDEIDDTLWYVINRVIDTIIGIFVAMIVNRYLFPNKSKNITTENNDDA